MTRRKKEKESDRKMTPDPREVRRREGTGLEIHERSGCCIFVYFCSVIFKSN